MFWNTFAKLCVDVGKPPNTVAAECGVKSSGTVTGWKNGAVPRPGILRNLADYFGIPVEELLDLNSLNEEYDELLMRKITGENVDAELEGKRRDLVTAINLSADSKKMQKITAPVTEDGLQALKDDERVLLEHYRSMTETDRDMMRDLARRLTHAD